MWSGVYTSAQATRGEAQFQTNCSECHDGDLDPRSTASRLVGDRFMDRWREDSLGYLFGFVSTSMPRRAPASLTEDVYLDVVSFLMRSNGFPAGERPLTKDALEDIRMERKSGPAPLPGGALVQVEGCLAVDPDETFFLNSATEPARARRSGDPTPQEIEAARGHALGPNSFRLTNFEFVRDFRRLDHLGKKVFVKGTLIRQTNKDRITIFAIKVLSADCG